jgi:hypothetical protein
MLLLQNINDLNIKVECPKLKKLCQDITKKHLSCKEGAYVVINHDQETIEKINNSNKSLIYKDIGSLLSYVQCSHQDRDEILKFLS